MSNVTSSNIGVSATDNLPTVEEMKAKSLDGVKNFLTARKAELDLEDKDINKLYDQKVKGDTFLDLKRDDLLDIQIPLGPAKKIVKLISDIKGEQSGGTEGLLRQRISELELALERLERATRKPGTANSVYMYIDNSNLFIQGRKAMAKREFVQENLVRIDFGRLVEFIQMGRSMGKAPFVAGSVPPPEDTIWRYLRKLGYDVKIFRRDCENREKEVDSSICTNISATVTRYTPATVILIAGDGDYGPPIREALDNNWTVEIWFWKVGFNDSCIKNMHIDHPRYERAMLRTTIMNLDDYYKRFMFAIGDNNNAGAKYLIIFSDIVNDNDVMECYIELNLFSWWLRPNSDTLKLYVKTYSQWVELKNLMITKYPSARQISRDAFFLEKDTFFKMYLSFLKHKVNST